MKGADVHNMKDDELVAKLVDATGELENTARLGATKRDVAKLLTVAKERGIDIEKELRK